MPDRFRPEDAEVAWLLTVHLAAALDAVQVRDDLARAVGARIVIEQATGIVMERHHIDPHQALAVLQRHSRSSHRLLHDTGEHLIRTGQLPGEAEPA